MIGLTKNQAIALAVVTPGLVDAITVYALKRKAKPAIITGAVVAGLTYGATQLYSALDTTTDGSTNEALAQAALYGGAGAAAGIVAYQFTGGIKSAIAIGLLTSVTFYAATFVGSLGVVAGQVSGAPS